MSTLFIDFETYFDDKKGISLKKMPLRKYLESAPIIGVSFAEDDDPFTWIPASDSAFMDWIQSYGQFILDPENVVVGHNAAPFDCRVPRFGRIGLDTPLLGCAYPLRVRDTLELSMASWPNQPTNYSLAALARHFGLPPKLSMADAIGGRVSWSEYCNHDGWLCREIYKKNLTRVSPEEIKVSELANAIRGLHYEVDSARVMTSLDEFCAMAEGAALAASEFLTHIGRDGTVIAEELFGRDGDSVKSVKPHVLKRVLLEALGFDTQTTSKKKINPTKLARCPEAAQLLEHTSRTGKGLYYKRRAAGLVGTKLIDMELGYCRATNTFRYSAPTTGRGVNKHNLTKRDKAVAEPLRKMFSLPDDMCLVRADASNVEYRIECLLSQCEYGMNLFKTNIDADPYAAFAKAAFGVDCKKGQPLRDVVAKAAVLGYGFAMGLRRAMEEMNKAISDPGNKVSLDDIEKLCRERGWGPLSSRYAKGAQSKVGCHWAIATSAYKSREAFHRIHHEFFALADWLQYTVTKAAGASEPQRAIDYCYQLAGAPDRNLLDLTIDSHLEHPTVRVTCLGHSMPTVTWRHLSCSHIGVDGLAAVTASKGPRNVHRALLIENVTQSSARNALVRAKLELNRRGWQYLDSVHDELRIVCARDRDTVLRARRDLLDVMGVSSPLGWAFYAKPSECTVTKTEYEDEKQAHQAWAKLEQGDPSWINHLT